MLNDQDLLSLLRRAKQGDALAFRELMTHLYEELLIIARNQRKKLGASDTLNTTAIVHEVYEKMSGAQKKPNGVSFKDRGHFFNVASKVMRDIIVDYARTKNAKKRGGNNKPVSIDGINHAAPQALDPSEVLNVHILLEELALKDPEAAKIVELRYFAGLTIDQVAEALASSPATIKRKWVVARAWLHKKLPER